MFNVDIQSKLMQLSGKPIHRQKVISSAKRHWRRSAQLGMGAWVCVCVCARARKKQVRSDQSV